MLVLPDYEHRRTSDSDIMAHLPRLHAEASGGKRVIELGVRSGNSTAAFLAAIERDGGHLWSVDIESPTVPSAWWGLECWTFIHGDDLELEPSMPNDVDLVFIDTSHTYSQTFDELVAYLGHLRPGGVFLLHDTEVRTPDGDGSGIDFPVVQAIEVFIASTGYSVEYVEGCNGLGVIRT